jgi:hypothetical protein
MGVRLVNLGEGQSLVAIARNAEAAGNGAALEVDGEDDAGSADGEHDAGPAEPVADDSEPASDAE